MVYFTTNQQVLLNTDLKSCSITECYHYLKNKSEICIDIETTRKYNKFFDIEGLDPYTSKIVMFQIGTLEHQFVIDTRNVDISILLPLLSSPNILKVGHNIKFEYKHLLHNYGVRLLNVYDTMVAEQVLFNGFNLPNSLEALNNRYLQIKVDKSTRLEFLTIGDRPFTLRQIKYGAEDVLHPLKIKPLQEKLTVEKDLKECLNLEFKFLLAIGEIEYKGVNFNQEKWKATYNNNLIIYQELIKKLDSFIISNFPGSKFIQEQLDLFDDNVKCKIQWSSSKQVIELFKFLDICPQAVSKTTKKLSYTVEAKEVRMFLVKNELDNTLKDFVSTYLQMKEAEQAVTTFGLKFLKNVNPITSRIHTSYKQIVNTGRISSSGPNLQNIPSKHTFRYAFDAPEGKVMVNADYSGQENIILVNKSMDKDLLYFYDQGLGDMHSYIALKLFPKELEGVELHEVKEKRKDLRQIAKSAGFALAYGGNGFTIANNLGISETEGEAVYDAYFKAFPGLKDFFIQEQTKALQSGYILIDELTKRKFFFKNYEEYLKHKKSKNFKALNYLEGKMKRASQNYVIQGEAGSITKYAVVLLNKWIRENNLWDHVKIVLLVHDEIVLEASQNLKETAAAKLQELMETAGSLWCKRIPLKAEAVVSNIWEH